MRWDAPPSDPIGDIRLAMEIAEQRRRANFEAHRWEHTRYAALLDLAKRRQDSGEAKAAIDAYQGDKSGNVWLCDEHGFLSAGGAPVIAPKWIAVGLGATFHEGAPPIGGRAATVITGVRLPDSAAEVPP
jgi:hypothetical protein